MLDTFESRRQREGVAIEGVGAVVGGRHVVARVGRCRRRLRLLWRGSSECVDAQRLRFGNVNEPRPGDRNGRIVHTT